MYAERHKDSNKVDNPFQYFTHFNDSVPNFEYLIFDISCFM